MALQSRKDELLIAWKAFDNNKTSEGWQTIPLSRSGPCRLFAGRHFPGNEEGLLIGFKSLNFSQFSQLPKGKGFVVSKADLGKEGDGIEWIVLTRQIGANLDLFILMVNDVISTLDSLSSASDEKIFTIFLSRIRAWQDFMRRDGQSVLTQQEEIGLFGELELFRNLVELGASPEQIVNAWEGPLNGVHDFSFLACAIEVKTTTSLVNFTITVGSLDQLDPLIKSPLYLAAVRLEESPSGKSITNQILELRNFFTDDYESLFMFNTKILQAGFLDSSADRYSKKFLKNEIFLMEVSDQFPYMSKNNVKKGIINAVYEIDLDNIGVSKFNANQVLEQLGVTK